MLSPNIYFGTVLSSVLVVFFQFISYWNFWVIANHQVTSKIAIIWNILHNSSNAETIEYKDNHEIVASSLVKLITYTLNYFNSLTAKTYNNKRNERSIVKVNEISKSHNKIENYCDSSQIYYENQFRNICNKIENLSSLNNWII